MTLVLGAMDGEVAAIVENMDVERRERWHGFPVVVGAIGGSPVVVSRTGVGKTLSAMLCQRLIDRHEPERIIFTGVAGALRKDLDIGDTVVAREALQHDLDVTALGFPVGQVPYSTWRVFACDPLLAERAMAVTPAQGHAHLGRILSGDQFIADAAKRETLARELEGDAVEMEGASVALVATVNEIPFLLIRTISDHADLSEEGSAVEFERVVELAAANSWHYLSTVLKDL
ncbi:MAG: 5'-methylthioadenosine/adenosylhomocysteine nucleosidase [Spirochaetota bacterium]